MQTQPLRVLLAAATLVAAASAQTVTVTISSDIIDVDPNTATVADLPGPDGQVSFSEAMIATNNTPGHQTVGFAIPQDDWQLQFALPGRAVLTSSVGFYFRAYDEVTIDGTTQTAFTGDTNPGGNEVAIYQKTLYLNADNCTLLGFDSTSVAATVSNAQVVGNTLMNITVSGSSHLIRGNTGGTIKIDRSNDSVVVGNTVQRVRVLGFGSSNPATNNRIGGPNIADRNFITGYGTWNSEGLPSGTTVQLSDTLDTLIENNYIGTTPDGLAQGSQASNIGIGFQGNNDGTIVRDNLIAGILGHGTGPHHAGQLFGWAVHFWAGAASDGATITGNTIGLDANGDPLLGSVWGIDTANSGSSGHRGIQIGGVSPGEGNVIAGHIFNGITIGNTTDDVRVSGNSIHSNGWLGIDLVPLNYGYGVTNNDVLDTDTGGNGLQNFPDIASATLQGSSMRVLGTLHSSPSANFTIEFFASQSCDDSGFGEGELFLGSTPAVTDASGDAAINVLLPVTAPTGWLVSSTATLEPAGATSEFSACVPVGGEVGSDYCAANANSTGSPADISAVGSASVAANDLVLITTHVPMGQFGVFYYGPDQISMPFGEGFQCVGGMVTRLNPPQLPVGTTVTRPTDYTTSPMNSGPGAITSGVTFNFQYWYRDPAGGPNGFNLSEAREITFIP